MRRQVAGLLVAGMLLTGSAAESASATAEPGERPVGGCRVFPKNNYWNTDVSHLRVDRRSRAWIAQMSPGRDLHPDFGPSYGDGPDYGIPVTTVTASHPRVPVTFAYADESDRVGYPLGADTRIEGGAGSGGDRHAVIVDTTSCRVYETWLTQLTAGGWSAGSGATWSLRRNALRPSGWTSADAAGLPILPGLLRWNEVRAGRVDHAIRFTTDRTAAAHIWPARHDAGSGPASTYPPMGARFRLRKGWSAKGLGRDARVVVRAMKTYGLVLADNGSPWYFQGEQNAAWPEPMIADLKTIPAAAFVAVDTRALRVSLHSARAKQHR